MKNKSVQNCRFVHHAKFHCIMTTLNRLFKIEFERGGGTGKEPTELQILCKKLQKMGTDKVNGTAIHLYFAARVD